MQKYIHFTLEQIYQISSDLKSVMVQSDNGRLFDSSLLFMFFSRVQGSGVQKGLGVHIGVQITFYYSLLCVAMFR